MMTAAFCSERDQNIEQLTPADGGSVLAFGRSMILYSMFVWWRDVIREAIENRATFQQPINAHQLAQAELVDVLVRGELIAAVTQPLRGEPDIPLSLAQVLQQDRGGIRVVQQFLVRSLELIVQRLNLTCPGPCCQRWQRLAKMSHYQLVDPLPMRQAQHCRQGRLASRRACFNL